MTEIEEQLSTASSSRPQMSTFAAARRSLPRTRRARVGAVPRDERGRLCRRRVFPWLERLLAELDALAAAGSHRHAVIAADVRGAAGHAIAAGHTIAVENARLNPDDDAGVVIVVRPGRTRGGAASAAELGAHGPPAWNAEATVREVSPR